MTSTSQLSAHCATEAMAGYAISSSPNLWQYKHPPTFYSQFRSKSFQTFPHGMAKKRAASSACCRKVHPCDAVFSSKRNFLLVGISVLPFVQQRARAFEEVTSTSLEQAGLNKENENKNTEPENQLLSIFNGIGIVGVGVLGALYALAQREKKSTEMTLQSLTNKLTEKEASMLKLGKNMEEKLINEQEKWKNLINKSMEEQSSLLSQLNAAKSSIVVLEDDLRKGKVALEDLNEKVSDLLHQLSKSREERNHIEQQLDQKVKTIDSLQDKIAFLESDIKLKEDDIQNLRCSVTETESQLDSLNAGHAHAMAKMEEKLQGKVKGIETVKTELDLLQAEIKNKEDEVQTFLCSLGEKDSRLSELDSFHDQIREEIIKAYSTVASLKDEILENGTSIDSTFRLANELNSALASLLREKMEIHEKLKGLEDDHHSLQLSFEKNENFNAEQLEKRENELRELDEKLRIAFSEIQQHQDVALDLTKEVEKLEEMYNSEVNNVRNITKELLDTQNALEILTQQELDLRKKSEQDLSFLSQKLNSVTQDREDLLKELAILNRNAEMAEKSLNDEKSVTNNLRNEVMTREEQILQEKEIRIAIEKNLEDAIRSLDEMNIGTSSLSREVENANLRVSSLETEKEILYKSILEHENAAKETYANMEDAHNMILRLGKERESFEKKAKKLENELASAKGELLRVRSELSLLKTTLQVENTIKEMKTPGKQPIRKKRSAPEQKEI